MEPVKRTEAPGYYEVIRFPMGKSLAFKYRFKRHLKVAEECNPVTYHYMYYVYNDR